MANSESKSLKETLKVSNKQLLHESNSELKLRVNNEMSIKNNSKTRNGKSQLNQFNTNYSSLF